MESTVLAVGKCDTHVCFLDTNWRGQSSSATGRLNFHGPGVTVDIHADTELARAYLTQGEVHDGDF